MIKLHRPQLLLPILVGMGCCAPGFADPRPASVRAGLGVATSQSTAFSDRDCEAILPVLVELQPAKCNPAKCNSVITSLGFENNNESLWL